MAKRCFIVISHYFDAKAKGTEVVEVVKNLKSKHYTEANIIIDVMKMEYVKNRLANEEGITQEMMTNLMVRSIEENKQKITEILAK